MSSVIAGESATEIVRGFGDKPGKLTAVGCRGNVIDAYGTDPNTPMGFYADHVFVYDGKLFQKLKGEFERGNIKELGRLWKTAVPYLSSEGDANE